MQLRILLIACLSAAIAHPSLDDLFASDPESSDSNSDHGYGPLIADASGVSQAPADDIWTGSGSNLLAYDAGVGKDPALDMVKIPNFDDSLGSGTLFPSDPSISPADEFPDQTLLVAGRESCSTNGMKIRKVRTRGFGLDTLWNMFRPDGDSEQSPTVCAPNSPSSPSKEKPVEPQTETGGGGSSGPLNPGDVCAPGYTLLCCPGELVEDSALEHCWDYRPILRVLCRTKSYLWCCLDYWEDSGVADICYRAFPFAVLN